MVPDPATKFKSHFYGQQQLQLLQGQQQTQQLWEEASMMNESLTSCLERGDDSRCKLEEGQELSTSIVKFNY